MTRLEKTIRGLNARCKMCDRLIPLYTKSRLYCSPKCKQMKHNHHWVVTNLTPFIRECREDECKSKEVWKVDEHGKITLHEKTDQEGHRKTH